MERADSGVDRAAGQVGSEASRSRRQHAAAPPCDSGPRDALEELGGEITAIVAPVTVCMATTVALVRTLNPSGLSDDRAVALASAFYHEREGDSTGVRLGGSLLNALGFVGVVALVTFALIWAFRRGYTRFIHAYMALATFSVFFVLTGMIMAQLLQRFRIRVDLASLGYALLNFAAVGAATMFILPAPLALRQAYLVVTAVATAYVFTWTPAWTTWMLLVAMALYDIAAVLVPGGPLKELVELAEERGEGIPALVYQARGSGPGGARGGRRDRDGPAAGEGPRELRAGAAGTSRSRPPTHLVGRDYRAASAAASSAAALGGAAAPSLFLGTRDAGPAGGGEISLASEAPVAVSGGLATDEDVTADRDSTDESSRLLPVSEVRGSASRRSAPSPPPRPAHLARLSPRAEAGVVLPPLAQPAPTSATASSVGLPDGIRLGLGDFIFYSLLVGRAAMYDWLTVYACAIAVLTGLGCTLAWLAVAQHALPALPVSIALAVIFYFATRFVMEPVVLPMSLSLAYF